jgi:hypothetical protein
MLLGLATSSPISTTVGTGSIISMKLFRLFIITLVCVLIAPISTAFSLTSEYNSDYDEYGNDVDEDGNYLKGNCVKLFQVSKVPTPHKGDIALRIKGISKNLMQYSPKYDIIYL